MRLLLFKVLSLVFSMELHFPLQPKMLASTSFKLKRKLRLRDLYCVKFRSLAKCHFIEIRLQQREDASQEILAKFLCSWYCIKVKVTAVLWYIS